MLILASASFLGFGQGGATTSSLTGRVVDSSGGVIPGADVLIKNTDTSTEFKTITSDNGTFSVPALSAGTYSATVTVPNFKVAVVNNIKLEVGVPATINVVLQVGGSSETIIVEAGAEMVQSQTAAITNTMVATQILYLPTGSRSALEAIMSLPGINISGTDSREARVVGLPENMVAITIDGISSQDNYLKTTDGMFSRIRPGIDAMEQVTVSTATPGAESAGVGAVQIRFVTRSGNNEYHGSLYEYLRNPMFNANSWFNNRNVRAPAGEDPLTWRSPRSPTRTHNFGGRVGGPIQIPKLWSGRDRAFFFFNYEESRQPGSVTRNQTILTPEGNLGNFVYTAGGVTRSVNLLNLAVANGHVATFDPTVQKLLTDIRESTKITGTIRPTTDPLYETFAFTLPSGTRWRYVTSRIDVNVTSKNRLEFTQNHNKLFGTPYDTTNGRSPAFPGFPNWGVQSSNRFNGSLTLRSTLTSRIVNEVRAGVSGGASQFNPNINESMFGGSTVGNMDGYVLSISNAGISNPYVLSSASRRNAPTKVIDETLSWSKGSHGLAFGVSWGKYDVWLWSRSNAAQAITLGTDNTYDPARLMFDTVNGPKNFPNANSTQLGNARNMYGVLVGRVTSVGGTAYIGEDSKYHYNGTTVNRGYYQEVGTYAQDSWRMRPNLTLTYGLRWQVSLPFVPGNSNYSTATVADIWGVSGIGNMYKPGTLTGKIPEFIQYTKGTKSYENQYTNFAPSFGIAYTMNRKEGLLGRLVGEGGKTVIRGGYSIAYSRMGMSTFLEQYSGNPGQSLTATRNVSRGNLVSGVGTDQWPILFRERNRLGPAPFPEAPTYPLVPTANCSPQPCGYSETASMTVFDPHIKEPYAQSFSFGIQRELSRSMAIEVRYVGTRSLQGWQGYDINDNENNIYENGVFEEFKLAMANLKANVANGKASSGFKYLGPNTGTYPLPITLGFINGLPASQAGDTTKYTGTLWTTSTTFVNTLNPVNPASGTYASNLHSDATRRANGLAAGYPANFFMVNPNLRGGATIRGNGGFGRYDSLVVEMRRRMAKGLLIQANYVWAKQFGSSRDSYRRGRIWDLTGGTVPHTFKVNWIYELPIGVGRTFGSMAHPIINHIIGGWDLHGIGRIQSGELNDFGSVTLVGMTPEELRSVYKLRFDDQNAIIYYMPADIIANNILAGSFSATTATGYSGALPTGRYIANTRMNGCLELFSDQCTQRHLYARDLPFMEWEISLVKQIRFTEQKNFELRAEFLNAFNATNFSMGTCGASSSLTQCQMSSAASTARRVQIVMRLNF
jgi:hypothetical protein